MSDPGERVRIRTTRPEDFDQIDALALRDYETGWPRECLASHLEVFPEGQLVATPADDDSRVIGFAASLIILWDEYDADEDWYDYTDDGMFTNHDPDHGHTLYGADVIVDRGMRRLGIGSALYAARRRLVREHGLWRIRAHSRLIGYHRHAAELTPQQYVRRVLRGEIADPTLNFQLRQGFHVLGVVSDYLDDDPARSRGHAALIEWVDEEAAPPEAWSKRRDWR